MSAKTETAIVEIVIKGQQANATLKDIERSALALRSQLRRLPVDSQEFANTSSQLAQVNTRLRSIREDAAGLGGVFQSIGRKIRAVGIIGGAVLAFDFIKSSISSIIKGNAELSDSFADIRKTTGMTDIEVRKLNTSFSQINTRSAAKELREIAIVGGQLGIAKGDIFGFTVAVDKMNVALGDEFTGGAEEVTKAMGGLRNVFTDIKTDKVDQDLLHIGNAINALASSGAATGPVVSDFANRIGGVGITLGLTSGQVLGLSATLQELNVNTERGGTAVTKILQKMTTNIPEFAKVAGMPIQEFANLVNKDLYGAFVKVAEGSKKGNVSATEFGKTLDLLGVDGAGASEVFAKLGSNTGLLDSKVKMANSSLKDTNSIMSEFNIKNQTSAADIEKISKGISIWFTSSSFSDALKSITGSLAEFFDKTPEVEKLTEAWRTQSATVENLETSMNPLLDRYDELKLKSNLNKSEQTELRDIIEKVSTTIPFAVSEFDKYGKAMDINTGKGRDFIDMEEQKLAVMNKDALKGRRDELIAITEQMTIYQNLLKNRDKDGDLFKTIKVKEDGIGDKAKYVFKDVKLTNEEITRLQANLLAAKDTQLGVFAIINELSGHVVKGSKAVVKAKKDEGDETVFIDEETNKKLIANRNNLLDELDKIAFEHGMFGKTQDEKEIIQLVEKYKVLREKAKGNKADLKKINELYGEELIELMKSQQDRLLSQWQTEDEKLLAKQKASNEFKKSSQKEINDVFLSAEQKEINAVKDKWQTKIDLAKEKGVELAGVQEALEKELADISKKYHKEDLDEFNLFQSTKQASFTEYVIAAESISNALSQREKIKEDAELKNIDSQYDSELSKLKKQYESKKLSKADYDKQVSQLEAKKRDEQRVIRNQAAEREKNAAIRSAIISGMQGVANTLGAYQYPYNLILAAMHAAAAAIQVANIQNAETPTYAKGGFNKKSNDPQGYTTDATLYTNSASGTNFIAGEAGQEWIAPHWMMQNPYTANVIDMLEGVRQRGFASGGSTSTAVPKFETSTKTASSKYQDNSNAQLISVVGDLNNTLQQLKAEGLAAYISYDVYQKTLNSFDSAKASAQVKN